MDSTACWPAIAAPWTGVFDIRRWSWPSAPLTLAGTLGLYVIVPKGFLPRQDTGVLMAVTEAAQSASIPKLAALQTRMAEIIRRDPAVTGVVSFVGAGTINTTPNTGRLTIALKPVGPARRHGRGDRPAAGRHRRHPRDHRVLPAGAGHPDRHPRQPDPVPVHADGYRRRRTRRLGAAAAATSLRTLPELATSPATSRTRVSALSSMWTATRRCGWGCRCRRSRTRCTTAFGQRQISTIFGQANQYRVVLEADPLWQADPNSLRLLRVPGAERRPGAAVRHRADRRGSSRRWSSRIRSSFPPSP